MYKSSLTLVLNNVIIDALVNGTLQAFEGKNYPLN